jgi:hypothetical protein
MSDVPNDRAWAGTTQVNSVSSPRSRLAAFTRADASLIEFILSSVVSYETGLLSSQSAVERVHFPDAGGHLVETISPGFWLIPEADRISDRLLSQKVSTTPVRDPEGEHACQDTFCDCVVAPETMGMRGSLEPV